MRAAYGTMTSGMANRVSRIVSADTSVLAYCKFSGRLTNAGAVVTAATLEVQANLVALTVNGGAEVGIGTYTGNSGTDAQVVFVDANIASIQGLVNALNGLAPGQTDVGPPYRWKASWGDFRPGFVIGAGDGLAVAAANALLGEDHPGLTILADSSGLAVANTLSAVLGGPTTARGTGQPIPDHFESDYTSTTAGVVSKNRAGQRRRQAEQPTVNFQTVITGIHCAATFANSDNVLRVYDKDNRLLWSYLLGAGTTPAVQAVSEDSPIVGPWGSPLWVEAAGTGALTDGNLVVTGYKNVA